MARRRGMRWRLMGVGGSGGGGGSLAEALLAEAAVRFDFSQYSDVNDMVDVNGGWGPLPPGDLLINNDAVEFTVDGLHVTDSLNAFVELELFGLASPVVFDADGLTAIKVIRVDAADGSGLSTDMNLGADSAGESVPSFGMNFTQDSGQEALASAFLSDQAFGDLVNIVNDPTGLNGGEVGTFVFTWVFDVAASELRFRAITPAGQFDNSYPFDLPAEFGDEIADFVIIGSQGVREQTLVEDVIWIRALTEAEVDALVAHFTPPPSEAELLLAEAAVRFDFSQYSDINDMVDVNGGWGPITTDFGGTIDTQEFTADGLHFVGNGLDIDWNIESVASPAMLGPDGFTVMSVVRNEAAFNLGESEAGITGFDLAGDGANTYVPEVGCNWRASVAEDDYDTYLYDLANTALVDKSFTDVSSGLNNASAGTYIQVVVVDVAAAEQRVTLVSPGGRFDHAFAFDGVGDFDPATAIDTVYYGTGTQPDDHTLDEWDLWNRALTPSEVDALVAHFEPVAQALLREAAVRFDFSQYSDINDMVDVNGGWGPIVPDFGAAVTEFTADGLRFTGAGVRPEWQIEGSPSPVILGAAGATYLGVVRIDAAFDPADGTLGIIKFEIAGDGLGDYAPNLAVTYECGYSLEPSNDAYDISLYDLPPEYDDLLNVRSQTDINSEDVTEGIFVCVIAIDVPASQTRVRLVSPLANFSDLHPFLSPPDFASVETVVDTMYYYGGEVPGDYTLIEDLFWNRALSEAEVDALVAHFTA